jgi:ABC-type uncharacterized transport system involved in gliding motility auxiliary subunit
MSAKTTHPVTRVVLGIIALVLIVVFGNLLVSSLGIGHRGLDFTENKVHTLSDGTKSILKELQAPVVIRYYASRSTAYMPEEMKLHMRHVDDLLKEYTTLAGGKLRVQNLDPQPDTDAEDSANLDGISGQRINDENLFFGLAISCLDKTTTLPFLDPRDETMLEYHLSKAVAEVSATRKPVVGVMSAFDLEGAPAMMPGQPPTPGWVIYQQLKQSYEIRNLTMTPEKIDPKEIKVLLLFHPAGITPAAEFAVDQYVLQGGTVIACLDPFSVAAQIVGGGNPMMGGGGVAPTSTLPTLLKNWGVSFESSQVVADGTYATLMQGNRKAAAVLTITKDAMPQKEDVITRNLESVTLFLPGAFTKTGGAGVSANTLIKTSENAGLVDAMKASQLDPSIATTMKREGHAYDLVLSLSGNFKSAFPDGKPSEPKPEGDAAKPEEKKPDSLKEATAPGNVFLIGDVDAFYDRFAYSVQNFGGMQMVSPINGNSSLLMNVIDQAAGSQYLIGARSRSATRRPFKVIQEMEDNFDKAVGADIAQIREKEKAAIDKLQALQAEKSKLNDPIASPEQEAAIKNLRNEQLKASKEIREKEKGLKSQKDALTGRITLLNVAGMPVVVTLFAIGLFIVRRSNTRAR